MGNNKVRSVKMVRGCGMSDERLIKICLRRELAGENKKIKKKKTIDGRHQRSSGLELKIGHTFSRKDIYLPEKRSADYWLLINRDLAWKKEWSSTTRNRRLIEMNGQSRNDNKKKKEKM